jgi:O-antigen/teichoic acid export membrane protein
MSQTEKKQESLTAQAAWILIAKIIGFALTIAVPLLLARQLSQTEFGLYKEVFLVLMTAGAILPFGFGMSAYYFLPREAADSPRRSGVVLNILLFYATVGFCAAAFLLVFPQSLAWLFKNPQMAEFAPALGAAIALWIFSAFLEHLVIANQESRLTLVFLVFSQASKAALFIAAALTFGTVKSLIWAAIVQGALQTVVLFVYIGARFSGFRRAWSPALFREQFFYVLPFALSGWLNTAQTDTHNYFVSRRFTPAEFAVYSVGCFELPLVSILAEAVGSVLIPLMSRLSSVDARREIVETMARVTRKLALVYFPLYAFLMITADTFITTLFTENYAASVPIYRLNLTLLPFAILALDPVTRSYKEIGYYLLKIRLVLFIFMLVALWFATSNFGLLEVNAVVVVVALVERVFATAKVARTIGFEKRDARLYGGTLRAALATVLSAAAFLIFHLLTISSLKPFFLAASENVLSSIKLGFVADFFGGALYLAICGAFFAAIYFIFCNVCGALDVSERRQILTFVQNPLRFRRRRAGVANPVPKQSEI